MSSTASSYHAFNEYVANFGGRYVSSNPEKAALQVTYLERLEATCLRRHLEPARRNDRPINLEIGYVNDPTFNAFAAHHNGVDLIALNRGNESRLSIALHLMLNVSPAFADVGAGEPRLDLRARGIVIHPNALRSEDLGHEMIVLSGTEQRTKLAFELAHIAQRFIIYHEMFHILNGHVDWVGECGALRMLNEGLSAAAHGLTNLDYQTLEYDADASAIGVLTSDAIAAAMTNTGRLGKAVPTSADSEIEREIEKVGFALYTVFKLFESEPNPAFEQVMKVEHPPARVRASFGLVGILTNLWRNFSVPFEVYREVIAQAFMDAEMAWNVVTDEPVAHIFTEDDYERGNKLLEMYNERWREIHSSLDRLKLGKSIARAWDDRL